MGQAYVRGADVSSTPSVMKPNESKSAQDTLCR
jgi:hypothetical protein